MFSQAKGRAEIQRLAEQADALGIESLAPEDALLVRAWAARGIIGNGGFKYFFEGEGDLALVAEGFERLGFPNAAQACRKVNARVLGALSEAGPAADRHGLLESLDWDQFDAEEDAVFDVEWDAFVAAIALKLSARLQ